MKIKHIGKPNYKYVAEALMSLSRTRLDTDHPPKTREEEIDATLRSAGHDPTSVGRWGAGIAAAAFAEFAYSGD